MTALRKPVLILLLLATVGLAGLGVKALTVFLAETPARAVALERRQWREIGRDPSPTQLAAEVGDLLRTLRRAPGDADSWYCLARNLHRLAGADVLLEPTSRQELTARLALNPDLENGPPPAFFLAAAGAAYQRAIDANRLISGARFWQTAAEMARRGPDVERWMQHDKRQVQQALRYDPQEPAIWRSAGDLAIEHGDLDAAIEWYRYSLSWKLDGLEKIVARLLAAPDGSRRLAEAIPENGEAWRRLADYLFRQWRFSAAESAFERALSLENKQPIRAPEGEAVLDGEFRLDADLLLHPWVIQSVRGAMVKRETTDEGKGVLKISFQNGPANWYHVSQLVEVQPGRRYRLSANVRVEGFAADEQFGVEVVHPFEARLFAKDARCRAGQRYGWSRDDGLAVSRGAFVVVETEVTVPDGNGAGADAGALRMLRVRLRRFGGDPQAHGKVAFTGVSLRLLPETKDAVLDEG